MRVKACEVSDLIVFISGDDVTDELPAPLEGLLADGADVSPVSVGFPRWIFSKANRSS